MAERRETQSQPQSNSRESLMDLDADLDLPSWPFDATTLLPSSTSPLSHSLMQLSFPNPPSPLWFFEDAPLNEFFKSTNGFEITNNNIDQKDNTIKKIQSLAPDGNSNLCPFRERMTQALRHLKQSGDQHILVQVWAPVKSHNKYVLSTSGQPFVLDPHSIGLQLYRTVSMMYMFSVDEEGDVDLGLPGRVFRRKMPEWTPDVQFYSSKEYPRLDHARNFDVRGSLALPVFEPSDQSCVGVVELIMTSQQFKYAPEVDKLCKALKSVNLRSYEIVDSPTVQICNEGRQNALAEIIEILTTICEAHKLPLAQTWVPCMHHSVLAHGGGSQKSCSSFDGSCMGQVCMSTSDVAVYVVDSHMWGFRDACLEHHLQKGQGVAGRAFETRSTCFCTDITQFCKTEYPLVHYARLFELSGCLSVCLQSAYTGDDDYILEFFLPPQCKDENEQKAIVESILNLMKKWFRSLKMVDDIELSQEGNFPNIIDVCVNGKNDQETRHVCGQSCSVHAIRDFEGNTVDGVVKDAGTEKNVKKKNGLVVSSGDKKPERKRGKAEKTICLEVLQQYFSGSLKDAAKALGVCPTTMKRICRQHGISRWPSRKINKVNRSLSKLKRVIESVQGAEGAFSIPSFACQLPLPLTLETSKQDEDNIKHKQVDNVDKASLKTSSSGEESIEEPTSLGSFEETTDQNVSFSLGNDYNISDPLEFNTTNLEDMEPMLGGNLIEDAGSSKDLKNLFNSVVNCTDNGNNTIDRPPPALQGLRTVTIKANYREDIIRFRLPGSAGIIELNEEVGKRLKLEVGTFDIRYLDDDKEWVMLSCDADFRECVEVARLSGVHIIRLSVHDMAMFIGSSCGSTGGLS